MHEKLYFKVLAVFSLGFWLVLGKICTNKDHTYLFHYINTCPVQRKLFEHSAYRLHVQTASSEPGKC